MNVKDWIAAYADRLGTEAPTAEEIKTVLDLARLRARRGARHVLGGRQGGALRRGVARHRPRAGAGGRLTAAI